MTLPVLDPELLQAFVAVADSRSFTRAAALLNRTQSGVSMQIKRLEQRLGAELFHRTKVAIELTGAGEGLLSYARQILSLNEEAVGRLAQYQVEGRVRLGAMDDYGALVLPAMLARFMALHPRIHVEMETGLTGGMVGRLGEAYDLVLAMHPVGYREGELLRRDQALWAASAGHRLWESNPLPVALYPSGCLFRRWAIEALERSQRAWRLAFISHNLSAVEAIAAQGLAVTVVKSSFQPARLQMLSAEHGLPALPPAEIRLHRTPGLSKAGALLAEHLSEAIRALPPLLSTR